MSNNLMSDALWWLRSRDKSALAFAGILLALLLVLLIYAFTRGGGSTETGSDAFVATDVTATPLPVFTPTPIPVATPIPTLALPTPVPTLTPTPELTTDDLVAGADNAEQVAADATATPAAAAADPVPTTTPIPAQTSAPAPTREPAATATPTATATVVGTPTPEPTPCIVGGGGFCLAPGAAPPATQATATATPNAAEATATAEALAPAATTEPTTGSSGAAATAVPAATATPPPVVTAQAIGEIVQNCNSDGSLLVFFQLTNPAGGPASVTGQPVVAGGAPVGAMTAPTGQSVNNSTTLPAGYVPGGQASISVNQIPIETVTIVNCGAATT